MRLRLRLEEGVRSGRSSIDRGMLLLCGCTIGAVNKLQTDNMQRTSILVVLVDVIE